MACIVFSNFLNLSRVFFLSFCFIVRFSRCCAAEVEGGYPAGFPHTARIAHIQISALGLVSKPSMYIGNDAVLLRFRYIRTNSFHCFHMIDLSFACEG
jgi:hypothetical protein